MQLHGINHLTAVTADARGNHDFYTRVLGMRLVKKTVNQDDTSAYHLFYADGLASPGSDLTFFDFPSAPERRGTRSIVRTGVRVAGAQTLDWWRQRFEAEGVRPHIVVETPASLTVCALALEGVGIGLVNPAAADGFDKRGLVIRPFEPAVYFKAYILFRPDAQRARLVREFTTALNEALRAGLPS